MSFERSRRLVALIVLLAGAPLVIAGTQARITGIVRNSAGDRIADAVIVITSEEQTDLSKSVKVDGDGAFSTLILDATKRYLFTVDAPGYLTHKEPFKVAAGSTDNAFEFVLRTEQEIAAVRASTILEQPGYAEAEAGRRLLLSGDSLGAARKFEEAVAARPDLLPAHIALADLAAERGDHAAALAHAKRCLELDDESTRCLAVAANAARALGDETAYASFLERYRELNPDDPGVLFNQAAELLNRMDDEGARPLLERCLGVNPDFGPCVFEYGMLLLRRGDLEGAKKQLQHYLEVEPDGDDAPTAAETIKYL